MENAILIGGIAVILILAAISSVRHFKGEGGCCSGGSNRSKKKKLKSVKYQRTFKIDGMHCQHCKQRVEELINDIPGLAGKVDLKKGELTILYSENLDDKVIITKIEKHGYRISQ